MYRKHLNLDREIMAGFYVMPSHDVTFSNDTIGEMASISVKDQMDFLNEASQKTQVVGTIHTHSPTEGELGAMLSPQDMINHLDMMEILPEYTHTLIFAKVYDRMAVTGIETPTDRDVPDELRAELKRLKFEVQDARALPPVRASMMGKMAEKMTEVGNWCYHEYETR